MVILLLMEDVYVWRRIKKFLRKVVKVIKIVYIIYIVVKVVVMVLGKRLMND